MNLKKELPQLTKEQQEIIDFWSVRGYEKITHCLGMSISLHLKDRYVHNGLCLQYLEQFRDKYLKQYKTKFKYKNYHQLREWLSEQEHIQWEHWSKEIAHRMERWCNDDWSKLTFEDNVTDQIMKWKFNWKPYNQLSEDIKDYDRVWADKILDNLPFKCPVYQCGGLMNPKERNPPINFIESEHFNGDEQTPDLICDNCGAVYQFKKFNKPEVTQYDLSQNNKKEVRHSSQD